MRRGYLVKNLIIAFLIGISITVSGDNANPVGTPNGAFAVSPLGGACYTVSIDQPSINTSLVPTINIVYNSQSGNGVVGWGCNISGISAITRGTKDYLHDNLIKGISHTPSDAYYLDGKRLVLESGTEGCSGAVYRIEGDPISSVTINSNSSGIWFTVHTADGIDYEYGKTSNSKQAYYSSAASEIRTNSWYVNKATNPINDYILYYYFQDELSVYVDSINYGNTYLSSSATINFEYENRNDIQYYWIENNKGQVGKRLGSVSSCIGSNIYRSYQLLYDTASDASGIKFSRLTSVIEQNGNNESLNPISLTWDFLPGTEQSVGTPYIPLAQPETGVDFSSRQFFTGDINGDGISDVIQVSPVTYSNGNGLTWNRTHAYIYYGQGVDEDDGSFSSPMICDYLPDFASPDWQNYCYGQNAIDIDGDGKQDIVLTKYDSSFNIVYNTWTLGKDVSSFSTNENGYGIHLYQSSDAPLAVYSDFNNNGKTDIFYLEKEGTNNIFAGHFFMPLPSGAYISAPLSIPSQPKKLFASDYNGNGLQDILVFYNNGYKIFWNRGGTENDHPFIDSLSTGATNIKDADHIYIGDFNGDGLPDFLQNNENDNNYYYALNIGNGMFVKTLACQLDVMDQSTNKDDNRFSFLVYDYNHDGRSDAVFIKSNYEHHGFPQFTNTYKNTDVRWLVSTGDSLRVIRKLTYNGGEDDAYGYNLLLGNFSGDGEVELMNFGKDLYTDGEVVTGVRNYLPPYDDTVAADDDSLSTAPVSRTTDSFYIYRSSQMTPSKGKLSSVTDGMGNRVSIDYKPLTIDYIYTKLNSSYPVVCPTIPLHVVYSSTTSGGTFGSQTTCYHYSGLKIHQKGRGLLGFTSMTSTYLPANIVKELSTQWDSVFYVPCQQSINTRYNGFSESSQTSFSIVPKQNGKNYFTYSSNIEETDCYDNKTITQFSYDTTLCKPVMIRTKWGTDVMYRQTVYGNYVYKGGRHLPTTITMTQKHIDDSQSFVQITNNTYTNNGLVTSVTENAGTQLALNKEYTYDAAGHLTRERTSGYGVPQLDILYGYDPAGWLLSKRTSPNSSLIYYNRDVWGQILTETDSTNLDYPLVTTNVYDGWGNLSSSTSPTGQTTTITRGWGTTASKKYFVRETKTDSPQLTTWYDAMGVKTREETVGDCSVAISTNYTYNNKGQLYQKNFTKGNLSITDSYFYDNLGRVISESSTTGASTTYSYGNRILTVTKAGQDYVKTFDAWGNVLTSSDPVSSIVYTYYSNGKPHTVTAGDGATVTMTYDAVGNQLTLNDPDAGLNTYQYDAAGRVVSQTDARGKTTANTYDALGRLTARTVDGAITSYTYGSSGNSAMRLVGMQNSDAAIVYTYDQYGRVTQETRNLNGENDIPIRYNYNNKGLLQTIQYPNSVTGIYGYDSNSLMCMYLINGNTLWRSVTESGVQTTSYLLGNNSLLLTGQRDYRGFLTGISLLNGTGNINNMAFSYDGTTGNLLSRSGMTNQTESFTYDGLNRLLTTSVGGSTTQSVSYDNNGNIIRKTSLGEYHYNTTKPHAVVSIDNTEGLIPENLQTVTYNAFGKVQHISDGEYEMDFVYGPDQQRWKTILKRNGTVIRKILYAGDYEQVITGDTVRHFYYGEHGSLCVRTGSSSNTYYHICTDNLGSVTKIVNNNGTSVFEASYDAWGRQMVTLNTIGFNRGYTGHEMMPEFGLINMNGRLYDPLIGRFLSTDNYVQEPWNSQNFNRYSYCLNNPLKYIDPSGDIAWFVPIIAGAVIGSALSGTTYTLSTWLLGQSWQPTAFWKAIGIGAFSGALGGTIGYTGTLLNISGNNVGFNMLGQVSNTIITNTVFNESTGVNDMLGIAFGTILGSALPKYTPSGKNLFANAVKETIANTARGGITGLARGAIDYAIKGDKKYLYEDFIGGAISGFSRSVLNNIVMGAPYTDATVEGQKVLFRTGGLFQALSIFHQKSGITLGANAQVKDKDIDTQNHELYHFIQEQSKEYGGWSGFYGSYFFELFKYFGKNQYNIPGTIEFNAKQFEWQMKRVRFGY